VDPIFPALSKIVMTLKENPREWTKKPTGRRLRENLLVFRQTKTTKSPATGRYQRVSSRPALPNDYFPVSGPKKMTRNLSAE